MKIVEKSQKREDQSCFGNIKHGTLFKIPERSGSIYMKVNTRGAGSGVDINMKGVTGLAVNMRIGTLISIPIGKIVYVLDAELEISPTTDLDCHQKR